MPFLFTLYLVSYLDRVNVSYASLEMTRSLGFSNQVFGLGSGIFFLGYLVLEIPGAILVERWSARKWIARILISWGFFATLTGANRYAILYRISAVKKPDTRARKIATYIAMLERGETIHG